VEEITLTGILWPWAH